MSALSRRALLGALLAAGATPAWAQRPEFAVGQVWTVRNLPGGLATIGRIGSYARGTVIHASIIADTPRQYIGWFGPVMHIGHSPIDSDAFARSADVLQQASGGVLDENFEGGYQQWRDAQGGVWTVDIADIVAGIGEAVAQQNPAQMSGDQFAIPTLIFNIIKDVRAREPDRPAVIGVAGAQGSGKTHWCALLEATNRPRFAHFSLDDVYLTKAQRTQLAAKLHPLFATRGPPGTHDLDLAYETIDALEEAKPGVETRLPRFDKVADDRAPQETWPVYTGWPEAILFDGWCVGAKHVEASPSAPPLNAVEAEEDAEGEWRRYVEGALATDYAGFFHGFDAIVYLRPPSWEIVRRWRGEQEEKLLGRAMTAEESAKLDRFVMHYERISRDMMDGHHTAKWIVHLGEARNVVRIEER